MLEKNIRSLEKCFQMAVNVGAKFVGVEVLMDQMDKPEIIINPSENIKFKLDYYRNAYNDNLVLKNCDRIRIVAFTYGNSLDEIKEKLSSMNG